MQSIFGQGITQKNSSCATQMVVLDPLGRASDVLTWAAEVCVRNYSTNTEDGIALLPSHPLK